MEEARPSTSNPKPVALMEYLIKLTLTKTKQCWILQWGQGTTGVACKNLNRKFIGIEKTKLILRLHKIELLQSNLSILRLMKDGHISIYVGRSKPAFGMYSIYSPQCNQSKAVADRIFNKSHFIPDVFF